MAVRPGGSCLRGGGRSEIAAPEFLSLPRAAPGHDGTPGPPFESDARASPNSAGSSRVRRERPRAPYNVEDVLSRSTRSDTARTDRNAGAPVSAAGEQRLTIAIPLFSDWESAALLLARLDQVFAERGLTASILIVDDGSQDASGAQRLGGPFRALTSVEVLRLSRNLGHQRAIAIGLTFLHQERPCDAVVVMDGDGEDRPEDVPRLYDELLAQGGRKVVFAERVRRSEGLVFRVFYQLYRVAHRLLTGVAVRVGNFSAVPYASLATFVVVSEAWNHYAASVFKARIPYTMVPIARGTRLAGRSTMNFVSLVTHGLSAISVFGDVVGVRLLIAALSCCALAVVSLLAFLVLRFVGRVDLPDSAGLWSAIALVLCLQLVAAAFVCTFFVLSSRNNLSFLPVRDYKFFVSRVTRVFPIQAGHG